MNDKVKNKPLKNLVFNIWNDSDPNDSFDVEASSYREALEKALAELGWCIGEGREIEEDLEEEIN